MLRRCLCFAATACFLVTLVTSSLAADWPTWRFDAGRSASTPEELPSSLNLQWTMALPTLKPAWPEDPRLQFDASYEPVIAGETLFYGSSRNDSVTAVDLKTGNRLWRFFAEGPVRFAPLVHKDKTVAKMCALPANRQHLLASKTRTSDLFVCRLAYCLRCLAYG